MAIKNAFKSLFGRKLGLDPAGDGLVAYGFGYHQDSIKTLSTSDTVKNSGFYLINSTTAAPGYTLGGPTGSGNIVEVSILSTSTAATLSLSSALGSILSTYGSSTYKLTFGTTNGYIGSAVRLVDLSTSYWKVLNHIDVVPSS